MKRILAVIGVVAALATFSTESMAQGVIIPKRVGRLTVTQATATTTAGALLSGNPTSMLVSWQVCHLLTSSATYLAVGDGTDPAASGRLLAPGACMSCSNCGPGTLKNLRVKGQASAPYSIEQYGE